MHNAHQFHSIDASPARRSRALRMRQFVTLGAVGAAGIAFAACGGSSGASSAPSTSAPAAGSSTPPTSLPGANGTIASITGSSLEVQNAQTGQTTVNYTSSTTIRQIATTSLSAVTVGSCISAIGKPTTTSSTKSPFGGPVTATTVSISQPVSGACSRGGAAGRPGGFGAGSGGTGGTRPGGGAFRPPSGRSFGNGSFATAFGAVTAVTGSTITVDETNPQTAKTSSVTVTATPTTTYSTTQDATAAAIVVGQCARAIGSADTTGAVTAQSLTISVPVNGACTTGFRFRGGPGSGSGAAPGA